jgi:hypothetical protein
MAQLPRWTEESQTKEQTALIDRFDQAIHAG